MQKLFRPLQVRSLTLKNRIVFAPTSTGRSGAEIYEKIAAGGAGLIVMADLSVTASMLGGPALDSMKYEEEFRSIIERCHRYGCMVSAQLFHPEYDVSHMRDLYLKAVRKEGMTPKDARKELTASTQTYCDELTAEETEGIILAFRDAALRAKKIGFDMIQIHGDRLLGSFTSPLFNHRKDLYGEHMELPSRVVKAVRAAVPDMPIDYKMTIRLDQEQLGRGGISLEEVPGAVRKLDACGVDSYHVTLANHTDTEDTIPTKDHPKLLGEGCFVHLAETVGKYTGRPVCAVGKIQTPEKAEEILNGDVELIAMSRQLIADPMWPKKVEEGRENEIVCCLYCNKRCLQSLKGGQGLGCVLHSSPAEEIRKQSTAQYVGWLNRSFKKYCDGRLEPHGLTNSLYLYLLYVKHQPGCSLVQIRDFFGYDKAYVTRMVSKLCGAGYLSKVQSKDDARSCSLNLTVRGEEILSVIRALPRTWDQELSDILEPEEEKELLRLLQKACAGIAKKEGREEIL